MLTRLHVACFFLALLTPAFEPLYASSEADEARIRHHSFTSRALDKSMAYTAIVPEGYDESRGDWPVLFFLHGLGRNENSLTDDPTCRQLLLRQPYVIILPRGEGGWYINSPVNPAARYADYLDEVFKRTAKDYRLSTDPARRGIGGWSAGGYGSVQTVLRHPGAFTALATIIGVVDYPREDTPENPLKFAVITGVFGTDPELWQAYNPLLSAKELQNVDVLVVIGDRAFDREMNERFVAELEAADVPVTVAHVPPGHTFAAIEQGLPYVLNFMRAHITADRN
ncbi:prolyl oligopeptidase family serine peptidase [Ruficoccus amylovorans]|uniref:Prolyl oligopeptidase family serine peptidase n=1 Tax=Ruficoccus amylovorans TaxID=1804625 RepID=A0A842HDI7_9BACT|nr:alpha/beta hydrolase-fold protein [Ruficoccus amylovorans]MBC2594269.1 prolyl oligopeptidase family serine peptidase [Ruficoccus amylovorans]